MTNPLPKLDSVEQRHNRDAASLLYLNGLSGTFISAASSSVLAFAFSGSLEISAAASWWALMMAVLILRTIDILVWHKKLKDTLFDGHKYKKRFVTGTAITGLVWAAFPFIAFSHQELIDLASMMVLLAAMAGGGATVLSADRRINIFYSTCLLVPTSTLSLVLSESVNIKFLGIMGLSFWIIMIVVSRKASEFTLSAVTLKNENQDLMLEMEQEKAEIQRVNSELEGAYGELNSINETLESKIEDRTKELKLLATRDSLTGLLNRKAFMPLLKACVEQDLENNTCTAVLFVDLDGFKEINDLKGHVVGDYVLQALSNKFAELSDFDGKICRWGGDEFIAVTTVANAEEAVNVAEKLAQLIREPIDIKFDRLNVGATVGVSFSPEHDTNEAALVHYADMAMYHRKRHNKGGVSVFEHEMLNKVHSHQVIKEGLRKAISLDELSLVYQPIVSAETQKPLCFEALLRWNHGGKAVSPAEFIPIAEESGLIQIIGEWVLKQACTEAMQWNSTIEASLSVNVSVKQLTDDRFLSLLKDIFSKTNFPAHRLHIEITEHLFAEDKEKMCSILSSIRKLGVKVALDDFGTGFCSLAYLQKLPVDEVKIDRTFVQDINGPGREIIKATVSVVNAFGCRCVAEGVETEEEKNKLMELGVDRLQGFYFAKPMPAQILIETYGDEQSASAS